MKIPIEGLLEELRREMLRGAEKETEWMGGLMLREAEREWESVAPELRQPIVVVISGGEVKLRFWMRDENGWRVIREGEADYLHREIQAGRYEGVKMRFFIQSNFGQRPKTVLVHTQHAHTRGFICTHRIIGQGKDAWLEVEPAGTARLP